MSEIGFLLGAGASYPFGIPMMREFYSEFVEYIRNKREHCYPLLQKIEKGFSKPPDLESLITQLDKIGGIRDGLGVLGEGEFSIATHIDAADELRGYLDAYLIETCEKFSNVKVDKFLTTFVEFCHENDAFVFTTNYDRLIETAADILSIPYIDGFQQESNRPESEWTGLVGDLHGMKLIKLHGSVNWYREDDSGNIFRLERGYSLPSHKYRLTHGSRALRPLMIIPTLEKAVLHKPYASLLTIFSDALVDMKVLFVIGNSMRDEHIKNTIETRANGLEIVFVNPEASHLQTLFDPNVSIHPISIGMEEFIEYGMSDLDAAYIQMKNCETTANLREVVDDYAGSVVSVVDDLSRMNEDEKRLIHRIRESSEIEKIEIIRNIKGTVHPIIIEQLRDIAINGNSDAEQIVAIDALAKIADKDALDILYQISQGTFSLSVRAEAVLALKSISDVTGIDTTDYLTQISSHDRTLGSLLQPNLV